MLSETGHPHIFTKDLSFYLLHSQHLSFFSAQTSRCFFVPFTAMCHDATHISSSDKEFLPANPRVIGRRVPTGLLRSRRTGCGRLIQRVLCRGQQGQIIFTTKDPAASEPSKVRFTANLRCQPTTASRPL